MTTKNTPDKPSLMFMVGPNRDENLIKRYNQYRQDPKKDNVLISTIYKAAQSVDDSPIPKNARDQVIKDRGFTTDSFLEMLKFPISARPSTFQECVDFFYPHSGIRSRPLDKSPFISTFIGAYDHPDDPNKWGDPTKSSIPASLGEVSMMYGWFIIYRLLLCPITCGKHPLLKPEDFFRATDKERILDKKAVRRATVDANSQVATLTMLKTAVNVAATAAKTYVAAGAPDVSSLDLDSIVNFIKSPEGNDVLQLLARGTNAITELISDQMGWNRKSAALVTSYLVEGVMSPEKYAELRRDAEYGVVDIVQLQATKELEDLHKLSFKDADLLARSSDFAITGTPPSKEIVGQLSEAGKKFLDDMKAKNASKFVGNFVSAELGKGRGAARPNEPILIGLGISLGAKAITAHMDAQAAAARRGAEKVKNFHTSILYEVDPSFSESGYSFSFETYENDGLLVYHSWMSGMDMNTRLSQAPRNFRKRIQRYKDEDEYWKYYPTCALQNGGEMISFWTDIYRIYRPAIHYYRVERARRGSVLDALSFASKQPLKFADRFPCKTFNVFYKTTLASTTALLKKLPAYSPFTHMFGFAPTILFNDPKSAGFKELNALKKTFGGATLPDMVVIGAPTAKYLESCAVGAIEPWIEARYGKRPGLNTHYTKKQAWEKKVRYPQSFSPGQKEFFSYQKRRPGRILDDLANDKLTDKTSYLSDWKIEDLQKSEAFRKTYMGDAFTVNSQRVLQDSFGGALSVGFDVALGIPVFNAQWAALMSVLFCYPEALDTLAQAGIKWAISLKKDVDSINAANKVIQARATASPQAKTTTRRVVPQATPTDADVKAAINIVSQMAFKSPLVKQALSKSEALKTPLVSTALSKIPTIIQPPTSPETTSQPIEASSDVKPTETPKSNTLRNVAIATSIAAVGAFSYIKLTQNK